jgi:2-polyprenyl-3-methyl-5-hydroxy-6-metoxy-1,4-benzoquinol methylase
MLIFQSALAIQCFNNEYIYDCSEIESNAIEVLVNLVNGKLNNDEQPSSQHILCLASYMSLYDYNFSKRIDCTPEIQEVFNQQIEDKEKEIAFKKKIPVLEEITNKISSKVRSQYENNPYPRWITSAHKANPKTISDIVNSLKLNINNSSIIDVNHPKILVAGCGTGQHSISTALRFANSEVLAVDLSLSSLAYAKRKTQELGIANISYMQADILDLNKLDEKFDLIECAGVLHHMDDPMAGWKILKNCLKDSGLMKIALYSELARFDIIKIREEISKLNIEASDIGMKLYRNKIINSDSDHHKLISISQDFYSMSALRDLLFHTQEHRFTIPQIKSSIRELGLKFMGFEDHINVSNFEVNNTEVGDLYDLDMWNIYEEANPAAFISMYQFWCQNSAR